MHLLELEKAQVQTKLWTFDFITIVSLSLLTSVALQMTIPTMPIYLTQLGASTALGGFANGILAMAAFLSRPMAGYFTEKKGRKKMILLGAIIFASGNLVISIIPTIVVIFVSRFIQGIGFAMIGTACGVAVADLSPKGRLSEGVGYFGLSNSISGAIGPSIAIFIIGSFSYRWFFSVVATLIFISALIATRINYEKKLFEIMKSIK